MVAKKARKKIPMLHQSMKLSFTKNLSIVHSCILPWMLADKKLGLSSNMRAAAAISPTEAGLRPVNAASTKRLFLKRSKKCEISSTNMKEGKEIAKVATIDPQALPVTL